MEQVLFIAQTKCKRKRKDKRKHRNTHELPTDVETPKGKIKCMPNELVDLFAENLLLARNLNKICETTIYLAR